MNPIRVSPRALAVHAKRSPLFQRFWPYFLLIGLLTLTLLALALRGLALGFIGDVLAYEYHYDRLGIQGGMNWLVTDHWRRHLLGALYSAPIHVFFPGQSAPWYFIAFLTHFANGLTGFLLVDTWLRGRYRWLIIASALMFVTHTLDASSNFEYPTNTHRNVALSLSLISLWAYLCYVRGKRRNLWWQHLSLATYILGFMSYEQTTLFFLMFPIIAYFEDQPAVGAVKTWIAKVTSDTILFILSLVFYAYVLWILFPDSIRTIRLSVPLLLGQFYDGFAQLSGVSNIWSGNPFSFQIDSPTLIVAISMFFLLWYLMSKEDRGILSQLNTRDAGKPSPAKLVLLGAAMVVLNLASVAPTGWNVSSAPRLLYPAMMGASFMWTGGLAWLLFRVGSTLIRRIVFSYVVALFIASGTSAILQAQEAYQRANSTRQTVLNAIEAAVPTWQGDVKPYIVFLSDAHPSQELHLHGQDVNFPFLFDRLYDSFGIAADAIYLDVPDSAAPAPDLPGSRYLGPYIVVEPEGIYSPLAPGVPIDPQRLVIVYYDSRAQTARVLDELPADVLETANIIQRAPIEWRTNYELVGP
jgi:hypothetical protein